MMINGFGGRNVQTCKCSPPLSLAQTPDNQGKAAGYLGSVMPIGHVLTPIVAHASSINLDQSIYIFLALLCALFPYYL